MKSLLLVAFLFALAALNVRAQSPEPLWPTGAPFAKGTAETDIPTLTTYLPVANPTRSAVLIAPGGGYLHLAIEKEGEDVARWLNAHGVAAFVLKYRLGPTYHHPAELSDAQRALRTVRARAAGLGLDPTHIGMCGFSAGGHLTATAGTLYSTNFYPPSDAIDRQSARPDFLILAYPVITLDQKYGHTGSRTGLLGDSPAPALVALLSPEKHVTANTPPTFLFATTDDKIVPVMNSVLFYSALIASHVSAEMHLYQHGPHGVGLAPGFPELKSWPDLLATWMRANGWMSPASALAANSTTTH